MMGALLFYRHSQIAQYMEIQIGDFPGGSARKESAYSVGDLGSIPGLGRSPWRRKWQSTPVFLPGEFHGQRSLAGYSPWVRKELDTTEQLTHTEDFLDSQRIH